MYRRRQYARKPRRYARKGKKGARLSKPMRAAMTRVAKKVISRRAEDKVCGSPVETNVLHNSAIGSADCKPLIMQVPQGVDSNHRLGDRITPKLLRVKGLITVTPDAPDVGRNLDIYVRLLILAQKDLKTGTEILANAVDAGALLRAGYGGTGDSIQFTGVTNQVLMPINHNLFRVYMDKTIKLSCWIDGSANGPISREWSYTFNKKHLPASLTFDEGNGDWPNNFAPFVALGYAYADGSAPDTVQTRLVTNTWSQLVFEDI